MGCGVLGALRVNPSSASHCLWPWTLMSLHPSEPQRPHLQIKPFLCAVQPCECVHFHVWFTLVSFYNAVSNQPTNHLRSEDTSSKFWLREMSLGLDSYNQRWSQIIQCGPVPPAQASHPTTQLLCLCLFKLIQTPTKPGENTAAIVREARDWQKECTKQPWRVAGLRSVCGEVSLNCQQSPVGQKKPAEPLGLGAD